MTASPTLGWSWGIVLYSSEKRICLTVKKELERAKCSFQKEGRLSEMGTWMSYSCMSSVYVTDIWYALTCSNDTDV